MQKLYERQIFRNNAEPALNETNINVLTKAVDDIDNRVVDLYITEEEVQEVRESTALTKKYRDEAYSTTPQGYADLVTDVSQLKSEVSNPNLLDNPFFTCNSRGLSSYTIGSGDGYSYDRWRIANYISITNSNGIITFTSTQTVGAHLFGQLLDISLGLGGKQVTISFLNTDGTVSSYSGIFNNQNTNEVMGIYQGLSVITRNHGTNYGFYLRKDSVDINISFKAIKIELGTVSTLANDSAPNTSEELLKCITSKADPSDEYANKGMTIVGNPNLLDNPFFQVNQRGQSSYSNGYTVDRWKSHNSSLVVTKLENGINITSSDRYYFSQTLGNAISGTYTFTLHIKTNASTRIGVQTSCNGTWSEWLILEKTYSANQDIYLIGTVNLTNVDRINIFISGNVDIYSSKLEYGSISTLANDHAPNYADELVRCQGSTADSSDTFANQTHNFVTLEGYTQSNTYASLTWLPYPSGFNMDNTTIVAFVWKTDEDYYTIPNMGVVYPQLRSSNIAIYASGEEYTRGRQFKLTIMKI